MGSHTRMILCYIRLLLLLALKLPFWRGALTWNEEWALGVERAPTPTLPTANNTMTTSVLQLQGIEFCLNELGEDTKVWTRTTVLLIPWLYPWETLLGGLYRAVFKLLGTQINCAEIGVWVLSCWICSKFLYSKGKWPHPLLLYLTAAKLDPITNLVSKVSLM